MAISCAGVLDCGPQSAVFARLRREAAGWRIEEVFAEPWEAQGRSAETRRLTLGRLAEKARPRGPITLLVPSHLLLAKHVKAPAIGGARREKVLRFAAAQAIPYPLPEVVWDHVISKEGPGDTDVLLLAAKREPVEQLCADAVDAGFQVETALPAPLAGLAAFRRRSEAAAGPELILTLGPGAHELFLVTPGAFWLRVFAAESGPEGAGAARLAVEVTRTLQHFRTAGAVGTAAPQALWLEGVNPAAGFAEELSARLKLPVRSLGAGTPTNDACAAGMSLRLVGAAEAAAGSGHGHADLLPRRFQEHVRARRRAPWLAAAALLALAALLPPIAHHRAEARAARAQAERLEVELAPQRAWEAHHRAQRARLEELRRQVAVLEELEDGRQRWVGLFADLQERLGRVEDVWFDRLELVPASAGDVGAPLRLAVSGRMLDRADPLARASPGAHERVKALFASIEASPFVAGVRGERFDSGQPGILRFDFELVADATRPL